MKKTILLIILVLFGAVTVFMSSSVLFDWFGIRAKEGNYVPGIVWANFVCGILYLVAAYGIFRNQIWARFPLTIALIILILAYIGLFIHINNGGLYETKTVGAMAFRIGVTALFLYATTKSFNK
ncbi:MULTISPECIES: hypothetical protein [unclassified Kaistella]|uniref:hypothetical protein n=1 Tax=unclassified Kaistella TaxID=2762626 RepID=UPI002735779B|nr:MULTISPECIES: hypothetical protein [unclassified Kaistella]MDP2453530.1 hypothetical protein [Kaistella sp. SH11-4b]MDP2456587.1 hypothetical protein [Kaistella sp. SH40-3]MDP2459343.1 hypothetical protein [Kaistella sp. SH19-2b]